MAGTTFEILGQSIGINLRSVFYWVGLETMSALILSKSAQVLGSQGKIKFSVLNKRKLSG
ncbi:MULTISPECIES: hypothetical protein [unclassified Microcoleus]|uniref:hypothetical protein n=1 Tax=unclassified Microcoleus TaxID=2642155 RepID=UPI002FD6C056